MVFANWSIDEQEEVKKFFKINELELEVWPKTINNNNELSISNSGLLDDDSSNLDNNNGSGLIIQRSYSINESGNNICSDLISMTESMVGAKSLLDEIKDPLGINDSLYQMQVQRILLDPKYNQPTIVSPSILLNSSNFDARLCLRLVHQFTAYEDLVGAIETLNSNIHSRKEVLKLLVRENFDRFVNAKNSIDSVYADIRIKGMNSGDFGMRPSTASVNAALEKSQQVYHPLLKRRNREECIRKRLGVFKEYKAIFNLPAALNRHIQLGEFQQCVYQYKRGRELLQAEPTNSTLKPILEGVWKIHVEKAATDLRNCLFEKLENPGFPYNVQSKIVGYLLELEATPDPILFYFNAKSSLIMRHCQGFQDEAVRAIEINLAQPKALPIEDHVAALLKDTLDIVESQLYENIIGLSYPTVREWKIITEAFNQLSGHLKSVLLPMAKFSVQLFDNRGSGNVFSRVSPQNLKEIYPKKLEESVKLIVDSFQSHVDSVFSAVMGQGGHVDNSIAGMYFTLKIVRQLGESFASILDTTPHVIMSSALKSSFAYVLNSLLSRVWMTGVVDCKNLGVIEDWKLNGNDFSTALVSSFENLMSFLVNSTISCRKIFYEVVQDSIGGTKSLDRIDQWFSKAFTEFVIEGMYRYVRPSTYENISNSNNNDSLNQQTITTTKTTTTIAESEDFDILDGIGRSDSIDLLKLNLPSRLLVVLSNVSYLQGEGLRNLLNLFSIANENSNGTNLLIPSPNPMSILAALGNVERAVTQLFLQSQVGRIIGPIESSWLREIDDNINVQSLISDVSPKDPYPLLRDLTNSLISSLLSILKELISGGLKDMRILIQGRIDVNFLRKRLENSLLNPESIELLNKIDSIFEEEMKMTIETENENGSSLLSSSLLSSGSVEAAYQMAWKQFECDWNGPFANLFSF